MYANCFIRLCFILQFWLLTVWFCYSFTNNLNKNDKRIEAHFSWVRCSCRRAAYHKLCIQKGKMPKAQTGGVCAWGAVEEAAHCHRWWRAIWLYPGITRRVFGDNIYVSSWQKVDKAHRILTGPCPVGMYKIAGLRTGFLFAIFQEGKEYILWKDKILSLIHI